MVPPVIPMNATRPIARNVVVMLWCWTSPASMSHTWVGLALIGLPSREPIQVVGEFAGRGLPLLRIFIQAFQANGLEVPGDRGTGRDGGTTSAWITSRIVPIAVSPWNGGRPVSAS